MLLLPDLEIKSRLWSSVTHGGGLAFRLHNSTAGIHSCFSQGTDSLCRQALLPCWCPTSSPLGPPTHVSIYLSWKLVLLGSWEMNLMMPHWFHSNSARICTGKATMKLSRRSVRTTILADAQTLRNAQKFPGQGLWNRAGQALQPAAAAPRAPQDFRAFMPTEHTTW